MSSAASADSRADMTAVRHRVRVLLPLPLAGPLDYLLEGEALPPGTFVRVPLSGAERTGVLWDDAGAGSADPDIPEDRLKPVLAVLEAPPLPEVQRRFIEWVARYTVAAPGAVLRMSMSVPAALRPPRAEIRYDAGGPEPARMTPAREAVLGVLQGGHPLPPKDLAAAAGVGIAVVRGLIKAGTLRAVEVAPDDGAPQPDPARAGPPLSDEQQPVAVSLREIVHGGAFQPILLEGVTGAGKTEVYFEAVAEALKEPGAQVLVLLPEIGLTAQWLERFRERFGVPPTEWHSDLGQTARRRAWRGVAEGRIRVVVGARSALFLPYRALRLIVVDEEHDPSFKQDEGVAYHARDMAVVRAMLGNFPIVLSTATPSFETVANVNAGKYLRFHLPSRFGGALLPEIEVIDMREEAPPTGRWLSPPLERAIAERLGRGEQSLLFLNRRGYAPLTLCRACGGRIDCPHCTAWLVEHRYRDELLCHHCGHRAPVPRICPTCGAEDSLVSCGPGVERLEEEVRTLFPEARVLVMASDTVTGPELAARQIGLIERGAVDIIIGTQIITKGYHFPGLTLVGVIDADLGLRGGDPRASERTFQQLSQVAGRAGRAERPGRVLLQTFMPEHPVVEALVAGDANRFAERELQLRDAEAMPPFGRLAALVISGPALPEVEAAARRLAAAAPHGTRGIEVLGPAPAPLARLRGRYRHRFLIKAEKGFPLQETIRQWLLRSGRQKGVRVRVDIDPLNFL